MRAGRQNGGDRPPHRRVPDGGKEEAPSRTLGPFAEDEKGFIPDWLVLGVSPTTMTKA